MNEIERLRREIELQGQSYFAGRADSPNLEDDDDGEGGSQLDAPLDFWLPHPLLHDEVSLDGADPKVSALPNNNDDARSEKNQELRYQHKLAAKNQLSSTPTLKR